MINTLTARNTLFYIVNTTANHAFHGAPTGMGARRRIIATDMDK